MNIVKKEEEPLQYGFSHTPLGMEKVLDKHGLEHKQTTPIQVVPKKKLINKKHNNSMLL